MSQFGIGVMINMLSANEESTGENFQSAINKEISKLIIDPEYNFGDGGLVITFTDKSGIVIYDAGRSCCESRWMHTDDELSAFVGAKLLDAEIRKGSVDESDYEYKESQFIIVKTSLGEFTLVNYNEHNGYYGGFWLVVESF